VPERTLKKKLTKNQRRKLQSIQEEIRIDEENSVLDIDKENEGKSKSMI
jgi:hypothetical protein